MTTMKSKTTVLWKRMCRIKRRTRTLLVVSCFVFIVLVTLINQIMPVLRLTYVKTYQPKQRHLADYMPESQVKYLLWYRRVMTSSKEPNNELSNHSAPYKTILLYNSYFGKDNWGLPLGKYFFDRCTIKNCILTDDRDILDISDAVVFYGGELGPFPPKKHSHQQWIFYSQESPSAYKAYELWKV